VQRPITVTGVGGVPPGAAAIVTNMTVTSTNAASFLTVWPGGQPIPNPLVSSLNWAPGTTIANAVTIRVGGSQIRVYNYAGTVDVVCDVVGYFL